MRRSPIVLTATVAGRAGVLAFHARVPAPTAAATPTSGRPTTSGSGSSSSLTATGAPVDTRYGPAQVEVAVANGKITSVQAVEVQNGDARSAAISAYAEPGRAQSGARRTSTQFWPPKPNALTSAVRTGASRASSGT